MHYKPHVTLTSSREKLMEGDSVRYRCRAQANPDNKLNYQWFVGGRRMNAPKTGENEDGSELVLDVVDRTLNGNLVRCEVTNSIGTSAAETVLDISCK